MKKEFPMVIDVHVHPAFYGPICDDKNRLLKRKQVMGYDLMSPFPLELVEKQMAFANIDKLVLLPEDTETIDGEIVISNEEIKTLIEDSHVQFRIDTPNVRVTKEEVEILASDEWVVFAPRPGNKETVFPVAYDKAHSKITVNGVEVTDGGVKCEHLPEECACNSVALTSRGVVVRHDENKPQVCTWKFEIAEK